MRKTLENLYYGNIVPGEQQFSRNTDYDKAMRILSECEEKLRLLLGEKEKTVLANMVSAQSAVNNITALENFILGFRLGLRIGVEVMEDADGSLTEIR